MERFPYRILVGWSEEDEAYVARVPALAGCIAHGESETDAVAEARAAADLMLDVMRENGDRVPAPDAGLSAFSGNLRLRISSSLHAQLDALAAAEGVSLNQLMVALLAEGAGRRGVAVEQASRRRVRYTVAETPLPGPRRRGGSAAGRHPPAVHQAEVRPRRSNESNVSYQVQEKPEAKRKGKP